MSQPTVVRVQRPTPGEDPQAAAELSSDCATVPSLPIHEALRSPAERGIAQYRHTWDGARLRAVGV